MFVLCYTILYYAILCATLGSLCCCGLLGPYLGPCMLTSPPEAMFVQVHPEALHCKGCRVGSTDYHHHHLAVSTNWSVLFAGVLLISLLLFGVQNRAPDFWKLPFFW